MQKIKRISLLLLGIILLWGCSAASKDTYKRTYDVSSPDQTVRQYIEIIQTFSPSLLREVLHFEGKKEREYFLSQIHQEILPYITSPQIEQFNEMTVNTVGIFVIGAIPVTEKFYIYMVNFNKPNLIYGIQPDILEFVRVKKYGKEWLIEVDFLYGEIEKEREYREEDAVMGPLRYELWVLERRQREMKRKSLSEVILEKTQADVKYELLRRNRDEWGHLPNYDAVLNRWRHMSSVYAGMSPADLQDYLIADIERQIEVTRNLLRR